MCFLINRLVSIDFHQYPSHQTDGHFAPHDPESAFRRTEDSNHAAWPLQDAHSLRGVATDALNELQDQVAPEGIRQPGVDTQVKPQDYSQQENIDEASLRHHGSLIKHKNHILITEGSLPRQCGRIYQIERADEENIPFKLAGGSAVKGPRGNELRDLSDWPDLLSAEKCDEWYCDFLLATTPGAMPRDIKDRVKGTRGKETVKNFNSTIDTGLQEYRAKNGRIGKGLYKKHNQEPEVKGLHLKTITQLSNDQIRYNTCWEVQSIHGQVKMRQPVSGSINRNHWFPVPCPTGDYKNAHLTAVLTVFYKCREIAGDKGGPWWAQYTGDGKERMKQRMKCLSEDGGRFHDDTCTHCNTEPALFSIT